MTLFNCILRCTSYVELFIRFQVYFALVLFDDHEVREFNVFRNVTFTLEYWFITRLCRMFVLEKSTDILFTSAI